MLLIYVLFVDLRFLTTILLVVSDSAACNLLTCGFVKCSVASPRFIVVRLSVIGSTALCIVEGLRMTSRG